jgi:hypothetical protein
MADLAMERPCSVSGCERLVGKHGARGLCPMHWQRFRTNGDPGEVERRRAENGSGTLRPDGYRAIYVNGVQVLEHRVVMAARIGRDLLPEEVVHHVDETKTDNEPDNLWLFPDVESHNEWHFMLATDGELRYDLGATLAPWAPTMSGA